MNNTLSIAHYINCPKCPDPPDCHPEFISVSRLTREILNRCCLWQSRLPAVRQVFISYRQNDNKPAAADRRDGWVTNFVAALKDELEATLKNPVSIYFDES